jgi:hypothetical protein
MGYLFENHKFYTLRGSTMTQEHPITPPPELVKQWEGTAYNAAPIPYTHHIARCAARWGADMELEACCVWLRGNDPYEHDYHQMLRAARRPKPPSLKEQALDELQSSFGRGYLKKEGADTIRRALESLPE